MPSFADSAAASLSRRSARRAVRTRFAPPAARRSANAKPIPALAPVTTAHFPDHLLRESVPTDASSVLRTRRHQTTIRGGAKARKAKQAKRTRRRGSREGKRCRADVHSRALDDPATSEPRRTQRQERRVLSKW